ncbi:MAG TPA: dTMP kinase [Verrucomicrobiae bacterium]|nr:dTMP kinase [Verrucomicrobiae bacterium]
MSNKIPRFIAFEGIDGSGQTTQATLLANRLQKEGHKVLLTKEPTNNLIGGLIRGALTHEWKPSNTVMQLLYAADRGHHLEREMLPALEKGFIVISDRYFFSSIAFGSLNCEMDWLKELNTQFPEPELVFYVDTPTDTALDRIAKNRFGFELFEEKEKLNKVKKAYALLAKEYPQTHILTGTESIEDIHEQIYAVVAKSLGPKN